MDCSDTVMVNWYPHYRSPTAPLDMHHLTCGINSVLHSVNLILFTVLLVHLILLISPHHSHHLCSHHLSLPRPFTPDLKLISFTNPFLHSLSVSFRTAFVDLNLYWTKWALAFVCFSFSCLHFYRAMHFSPKRGIAITCLLSVRLSVCLPVCL